MRDVGLTIAVIFALLYGGRLMGALNHWLQSECIKNENDEPMQENDQVN